MKKITRLLVLIGIVILTAFSCEETNTECGCTGQTLYSISDSEPQIGKISYKIQIDSLDNYYNDKFWIGYTEDNCISCVHVFIVCNEKIISSELKSELLLGGDIDVKFSGQVKDVCDKIYAPAGYTYNRIILTKIERL